MIYDSITKPLTHLIKRGRNVRGDNLGHRKRDPHHHQQLPVERRQGRGQRFTTSFFRIEKRRWLKLVKKKLDLKNRLWQPCLTVKLYIFEGRIFKM